VLLRVCGCCCCFTFGSLFSFVRGWWEVLEKVNPRVPLAHAKLRITHQTQSHFLAHCCLCTKSSRRSRVTKSHATNGSVSLADTREAHVGEIVIARTLRGQCRNEAEEALAASLSRVASEPLLCFAGVARLVDLCEATCIKLQDESWFMVLFLVVLYLQNVSKSCSSMNLGSHWYAPVLSPSTRFAFSS